MKKGALCALFLSRPPGLRHPATLVGLDDAQRRQNHQHDKKGDRKAHADRKRPDGSSSLALVSEQTDECRAQGHHDRDEHGDDKETNKRMVFHWAVGYSRENTREHCKPPTAYPEGPLNALWRSCPANLGPDWGPSPCLADDEARVLAVGPGRPEETAP